MPSNRALARIRHYNCSPSRRTSRHDNASSARETNHSARSKRKGGGHVDDQSRRHRSKSRNTDRDSTTPTDRRKRNDDSNATISNSKDSRPKNGPTSRATEAEVSRTVSVPVQESRSVEREVEGETILEAAPFLLMKVGQGGRELAPFHLRLGEKVQLHVSLNVLGLGLTLKG